MERAMTTGYNDSLKSVASEAVCGLERGDAFVQHKKSSVPQTRYMFLANNQSDGA